MPDLSRLAKQYSTMTFPSTTDILPIVGGTTIRKYNLHFSATYKQGAVNGVLGPDAPHSIIRRLAYYLGGAPLRDADNRFWKWWNTVQQFGTGPNFVAPSVVGNASTAISFDTHMDMAQLDLLAPVGDAFVLDTRGLDVNFTFDWGNPVGDIDSSAQAGSTLTSPLLTINAVDDSTAAGKASKLQVSKLTIVPAQIVANGLFQQAIQAKGPAYRGIAISARSGSTDWNQASGDDSFISYVSLVGDNAIKFFDRVPWAHFQADNRKIYRFNSTGWVLLDFARDQTLRHLVYTLTQQGRISDLVLTLEFASTLPSNPWVLVYPINDILYFRPPAPGGRGAPQLLAARR